MAVTDLWHNTLVYFGMADEPDDYVEDYDDETETALTAARARPQRTRTDDLERSYRERPERAPARPPPPRRRLRRHLRRGAAALGAAA